MKSITEYFRNQDNLLPISAWITVGIMVAIFIVTQVLSFMNLVTESNSSTKKMVVHEIMKLKFAPKVKKELHNNSRQKHKKSSHNRIDQQREKQQSVQERNEEPQFASIIKGFNIKKLISPKTNKGKSGKPNHVAQSSAKISTKANKQLRTVANFDLSRSVKGQQSNRYVAKRSATGGTQGPKVGTGGNRNIGNGTGSGLDGIGFSNNGNGRATRGAGNGQTGRVTIGLPSASGKSDGTIDIHALIKWMKAHPGIIPKLVAYDMGHRAGDLASAVSFTMNGRKFNLFLSCNEIELLLRICLIEGNGFTLLKDNGIQEESNFLIIGSVVREKGAIQSLISSRRSPVNKAALFYQIFWSWWLRQQ